MYDLVRADAGESFVSIARLARYNLVAAIRRRLIFSVATDSCPPPPSLPISIAIVDLLYLESPVSVGINNLIINLIKRSYAGRRVVRTRA